jgi:undecaprenyl-diphosphatase
MPSRSSALAPLSLGQAAARAEQPELSLRQALLLGALHGPAELLPISSSGHLTAVPWLLGWRYDELDGELRKSFEVALHAGSVTALLLALRSEIAQAVVALDRRRLAVVVLSCAPPAVAGYVLERPIERRLGTQPTVAAGLLAGAVAMALADRAPQTRTHDDAGPRDGLWLGAAQALALVPGVSRNGATLAAARLLRFTRADADRLSLHAGLPVIAGAATLKGLRLRGRAAEPGAGRAPAAEPWARGALAVGAGAAFVSTLASAWMGRRGLSGRSLGVRGRSRSERGRPLLPYALYRAGLAAVIIRRLAR